MRRGGDSVHRHASCNKGSRVGTVLITGSHLCTSECLQQQEGHGWIIMTMGPGHKLANGPHLHKKHECSLFKCADLVVH